MPDPILPPPDQDSSVAAETTPHKEGKASILEATPGAGAALAIVWVSQHTSHPMDLNTATGLVAIFSLLSSYVMAFLRERRKV